MAVLRQGPRLALGKPVQLANHTDLRSTCCLQGLGVRVNAGPFTLADLQVWFPKGTQNIVGLR